MIATLILELNFAKRLQSKLEADHYDEDYATLTELLEDAIKNAKPETLKVK